jgi:hypothetical protein
MLVAPLKFTRPEFHDRNVKAKNNGKGRDEVCLPLEAGKRGFSRDKIVRITRVRGVKKALTESN